MTTLSTPKGEIIIRVAIIDDAGLLRELRLESLAMHPTALAADLAMTTAEGMEIWQDRIAEYSSEKSGVINIACAGDELIGMAGVTRGHWPKMRHGATLWGVYVKPGWRGLHIGRGLINGCIQWARENRMTVLYLGVTNTELAAIRCYTHCGFTEYGIEPRVIFYEGIYYDQLLMVKLLD